MYERAGQRGSFSQMYQDVFVQAVAGHNNWTTGYYLEVGAFHGVWYVHFDAITTGIRVPCFCAQSPL